MTGTENMTGSSPRVLIVEDNKDGRDTLKLLLMIHGCPVDTAADGVEGVRKGMELRPSVAVIDLGLPGMSGYEVAWQLRSMFKRNILLIAHTGSSEASDHDRAKKAGFDLLVTKAGRPEELLDVLRVGTGLPLRKPAA